MSTYPGFTNGDLIRQASSVKADLRYAKAMGKDEASDAAQEELDRIRDEQRRRSQIDRLSSGLPRRTA
jgi:ABC-type transport system involved in cytochrome c biogenesis ATPase subunit